MKGKNEFTLLQRKRKLLYYRTGDWECWIFQHDWQSSAGEICGFWKKGLFTGSIDVVFSGRNSRSGSTKISGGGILLYVAGSHWVISKS